MYLLAHTISTSEVWQCKKLSTIKLASWYLYQRSHRYGNSKKDYKIQRNGRSLADNDTDAISVKNKSCKSLLTLIIVTANMWGAKSSKNGDVIGISDMWKNMRERNRDGLIIYEVLAEKIQVFIFESSRKVTRKSGIWKHNRRIATINVFINFLQVFHLHDSYRKHLYFSSFQLFSGVFHTTKIYTYS